MKKLLAILISICMMTSLSIVIFANDTYQETYFHRVSDLGIQSPSDVFGIGVPINNRGIIEEVTLYDVIEQAQLGGLLVMEFESTGYLGNDPHPVIQFNCSESEDLQGVSFEVSNNGNGTYVAYVSLEDVLTDLTDKGNDVADIFNCGVQVWSENFVLHRVYATNEAPFISVDEEPAETGLAFAGITATVALAIFVFSKKH